MRFLGMLALVFVVGALWTIASRLGAVLAARLDRAMLPISRPVVSWLDRVDWWMEQHIRSRLPRWAFNERIVVFLFGGIPAILLTAFALYLTSR